MDDSSRLESRESLAMDASFFRNGNGLPSKCSPVWASALLPHGAVVPHVPPKKQDFGGTLAQPSPKESLCGHSS